MTDFQSLKLNPILLSALEKKGYTTPTPIQEAAIPEILAGNDFLGVAQTGTGKTAAFALPIIQLLTLKPSSEEGQEASSSKKKKPLSHQIRSLILTPTRELALQITENFTIYGKNSHLTCAAIYGGVSEVGQISALKKGVDVLIATPGRLIDLTNQGFIDYCTLEILVLDEADRMLDMGFIDDIKKIIAKLPKTRQTLFFSATMPKAIESLANSILRNPIKVEITPQSSTVEKISQKVFMVSKSNKAELLCKLLKDLNINSALIFCQMKHSANRLSSILTQQGFENNVLHGNKSQNAREKALQSFRDGKCKLLIATDIAARGIDIPDISHVFNFDLPRDIENYVHRIGRTARAGRDGMAISLCDTTEITSLRSIERTIGQKIPTDNSLMEHNFENSSSMKMTGVLISSRNSSRPKNNEENPPKEFGFGRKISSTKKTSSSRASSEDNGTKNEHKTDEKASFSNQRISDSEEITRNSRTRQHSRNSNSRERQTDRTENSFGARKPGEYRREGAEESYRDRTHRNSSRNASFQNGKENQEFSPRRSSSGFDKSMGEEKKVGILQRIFGKLGKKDSRSGLEEGVFKRFTNKNSFNDKSYNPRSPSRSSGSRNQDGLTRGSGSRFSGGNNRNQQGSRSFGGGRRGSGK